ncbi:S-layer homology domain-containing protein [Niallia oryzisoli]|uniref:S-layer homology domain-containing protein n=1 Tax=Niallia oryzisoli TaxID=1737571 RepID=A0ABZ2CFG7_9BACI
MAKSYRKFIAGAATAAVVASSFAGVAGAASFSDVDSSTTHNAAISALVDKGIISGYEDGTFRPYAQINRGEAAIIVARALGLLDGKNIPSNPFSDVSENQAAYEAIVKLADKGIVSGFNDDTFRPYDKVTKAQAAKYIALAYGYEPADGITKFPDVNENSALAAYVDVLADHNIVAGKANGNFGYGDNLRRGDFAGIIYRAEIAKEPGTGNPGDPIKPTPNANPITITEASNTPGNSLTNGSEKTYQVKVVNPNSKLPVENVTVNVTFLENIDTDSSQRREVTVMNPVTGKKVIPYQEKQGQEAVAQIKTDKNGVATFTISGTNATVTPVAFLDGSNQKWDTNGGPIIETVNGRFEQNTELYTQAKPVTFGVTQYKIEVTPKRTDDAAVTEIYKNRELKKAEISVLNGREFTVKVLKPDGTPYKGGVVNVGIDEYINSELGTAPRSAFLATKSGGLLDNAITKVIGTDDANYNLTATKQGTVRLDQNGEATFVLASTRAGDAARPFIWVDQNFDNNDRDQVYDKGEPTSVRTNIPVTDFQPSRVDNGSLGSKLEVTELSYAARTKFKAPTDYWKNIEDVKGFNFTILNQSGTPFLPPAGGSFDEKDATVTYEIINTGGNPIRVHTAEYLINPALQDAQLADWATLTGTSDGRVVEIQVGGRVTITGNIDYAKWYDPNNSAQIAIYALGGKSSASVKASAVVDDNAGNESKNVYVYSESKSYELSNSNYAPKVVGVLERDTNLDGNIDEITLSFDKEVDINTVEAGDFRLFLGSTDLNQPAISAVYGKKTNDLTKDDKTKIVLKVEENPGIGDPNPTIGLVDTRLYYDPSFSGSKALSDGFGNVTRAFIVTDNGNNGSYEVNPK